MCKVILCKSKVSEMYLIFYTFFFHFYSVLIFKILFLCVFRFQFSLLCWQTVQLKARRNFFARKSRCAKIIKYICKDRIGIYLVNAGKIFESICIHLRFSDEKCESFANESLLNQMTILCVPNQIVSSRYLRVPRARPSLASF